MFIKFLKDSKKGLDTPLEKFLAGAILAVYDLVFVALGLVFIAGCSETESSWWGFFITIAAMAVAVFWYFWPRCGWNTKKTLRAIKIFYSER